MRKLNLGCGSEWRGQYPNHEGLDIIDYGQKYVGNVLEILPELGGGMFDEVMANHFLEHFTPEELKAIISNVNRLLKTGGLFKIAVPHLKKERAWILSHKSFWNEETAKWLCEEEAERVYGFGKWEMEGVVTNSRKDIHVVLRKAV